MGGDCGGTYGRPWGVTMGGDCRGNCGGTMEGDHGRLWGFHGKTMGRPWG